MSRREPVTADALPPAIAERLAWLGRILSDSKTGDALTGPILASSGALAEFLQRHMARLPREQFRVLFLDASNRLLLDRVMWEGTVDRVHAYPREIVRVAIETGATALILVHNHPSGRSQPSNEDIRITQQIVLACAPLDIVVNDHLIVSSAEVLSMASRCPPLFVAPRLDAFMSK